MFFPRFIKLNGRVLALILGVLWCNSLTGCDEDRLNDPSYPSGPVPSGIIAGDVVILSQENLELNFGITEIKGSLTIGPSDDIFDLAPLASLETIGGDLRILNNDNLLSLAGLGELDSLRNFIVAWNHALVELGDRGSCPELVALMIYDCPALTSLAGFSGLPKLSFFLLGETQALLDLEGLPPLPSLRSLDIKKNTGLSSLSGLPELPNLSFLTVMGNPNLVSLAGVPTTADSYDLRISNNESLNSLAALAGYSVLNSLEISSCPNLLSLAGLEELRLINFGLQIGFNSQLADISGLAGIQQVGGALIFDNPVLDQCVAEDLAATWTSEGIITIFNNGPCQ